MLKESLPLKVAWGVYKEPLGFHLRLSELTQVSYAPETAKVMIGTREVDGIKYRGDILAPQSPSALDGLAPRRRTAACIWDDA